MDRHIAATKYLRETFSSDELRSFLLAGASDCLMEKLAKNLKAVDTNELWRHEALDDWRYLLLAKAAMSYLQGKAYSF